MLLVFGCTQQTNTNTTNTPAPVNNVPTTPAPTVAKADFSIDSPAVGSTVASGTVVVKLTPKNFKVVAPGANVAGEGHFHLFLDDGSYIPCASTTCEVTNVSAGTHTIKVTVQNNDHSTNVDVAAKSVTFTVQLQQVLPNTNWWI